MRIRFLGSDTHQSFHASGMAGFAIPWAVGDERGVSDAEGAWALATHPEMFQSLDEAGEAVSTAHAAKVEALGAPESDKKIRAPKKKG